MRDTKFPTQKQDPDYVAKQTSHPEVADFNSAAKRPQNKTGKLKTLQAKRYAYNRKTDQQPGHSPKDSQDNPTKKQPDKITY